MANPDKVFIVIRELPYIYTEVERVFLEEGLAHEYIADRYPYMIYYREHDFYAMSELTPDQLENEERYYILVKQVSDDS